MLHPWIHLIFVLTSYPNRSQLTILENDKRTSTRVNNRSYGSLDARMNVHASEKRGNLKALACGFRVADRVFGGAGSDIESAIGIEDDRY